MCENDNALHHRLCLVPFVPSRRTATFESPGFLPSRNHVFLRIHVQICVAHFAFPRMRYACEVLAQQYSPRRDRIWEFIIMESHGGHGRLGEKVRSRIEPPVFDRRLYFSICKVLGAQALSRRPALKRGTATTNGDKESELRRRIEGTCACTAVNATYSAFSLRFLNHDDNCNDNSDWESERRGSQSR